MTNLGRTTRDEPRAYREFVPAWQRDVPEQAVEITYRGTTTSATNSDMNQQVLQRVLEHQYSTALAAWFRPVSAVPAADRADEQMRKNQAAIELLEGWLADESGCDEQEWLKLQSTIEQNRLSHRKRFRE